MELKIHDGDNTVSDQERRAHEFSGIIYLRDDEIEEFEDALEEAICPDPGDEEKDEHDCRLGCWTLKISPPEDTDE